MCFYLLLQGRLLLRQLRAFGLAPWIGVPLLSTLFVAFSIALFRQLEKASFLYLLLALVLLYRSSNKKRFDFLRLQFEVRNYRPIRLLENFLLAAPFFPALIAYQQFSTAIVLLLALVCFAWIELPQLPSLAIPTPFSKRPFEYSSGFRTTWWALLLCYLLCAIACRSNNFSLGIFSIILLFLIQLSYYSKAEQEYLVWIHHQKASGFLWDKLRTACFFAACISLPLVLLLAVFFSANLSILLVVWLLAFLYLGSIVLAKYAAYPDELNPAQALVMGLCFTFPPLLLAVIPYFYQRACIHLKDYLG